MQNAKGLTIVVFAARAGAGGRPGDRLGRHPLKRHRPGDQPTKPASTTSTLPPSSPPPPRVTCAAGGKVTGFHRRDTHGSDAIARRCASNSADLAGGLHQVAVTGRRKTPY